jgi:hypothetical protein
LIQSGSIKHLLTENKAPRAIIEEIVARAYSVESSEKKAASPARCLSDSLSFWTFIGPYLKICIREFSYNTEDEAAVGTRANRHRAALASCVAASLFSTAPPAVAIVPDDPGPAAVQFRINSGEDVHSISPYIYGSNSSAITSRTFDRSGGNRMTGYNWETNASNAGADWYHHSDYFLTGRRGEPAAGRCRERHDSERGCQRQVGSRHHSHGRLRIR